jgi:hypothetical protein
MAKWDFKIVGASFVKELVPVLGDSNPRSESFMQPSFDLEGGKIVMKESGQYKTAIYFSQIGEIDGVAPTDIEDAYAKLLTLVENFNGGGGAPGTTPNLTQVVTEGELIYNQITAISPATSHTFQLTDAYKFTVLDNTVLEVKLIDSGFPTNTVFRFRTFTGCLFTSTDDISYNGGLGNSINIDVSDYCELKKIASPNFWMLTVTDKLTASNMHTYVDSLTSLATPVDADRMIIVDNSASLAKKITWANIKATLKTYFDILYQPITSATTGSVMAFATPKVYNSIASPSSSNITDSLTGARIGVVQKIYHNAGTAPTVPAGWVKRGTGSYVTSTLNIIYAEWSVGTTVEYWITQ